MNFVLPPKQDGIGAFGNCSKDEKGAVLGICDIYNKDLLRLDCISSRGWW